MEVTREQLDKFHEDCEKQIKEDMEKVDSKFSKLYSDFQAHSLFDIERFESVNSRFDSYVKFSTFTWVFGIAMIIIIGLFSVIWNELRLTNNEIRSTNENVYDVKVETTYLRGQWDLWTKE